MKKALFFDRDGTLIKHRPYLHKPEEVILLNGTVEGLRLAKEIGYTFFLFTNQSGVGRGYFSLDDVRRVNKQMLDLIGLGPSLFSEICIATETPNEISSYRKPSPRFILEMLAKHNLSNKSCWMIGDSPSDWEAGRLASVRTAAISVTPSDETLSPTARESFPLFYPTLVDFVRANSD